ncbi:DUF1810 domain-containing protein [Tianweitania sp.]|uniref:DUF1810 domain-containing protein n=1 Tax=Tianweitania sp. TaxID=2021634 RepID=UPI0028A01688|nr:DUF1810 domain-containing protein [Tianweitania sp.]
MAPTGSFDLSRFLDAQAGTYASALSELRGGRKLSHWMWFIFPQLRGLGRSPMAERYGIIGLAEAQAYLADSVLGSRLEECTAAVLCHPHLSVHKIFGSPDDLKFHSSMTLFSLAAGGGSVFREALEAFFSGKMDNGTLRLLKLEPDA